MPGLNDKQLEACCTTDGPLLILAGAGSGKTRVITHRIAYLIDEMSVNPYNILAITFTNKAAAEMRERVDNLVGFGAESVWVSTFHSMCVRILRKHIDKIGGTSSFTIYDASEQKTVVKEVLKYLQLDPKLYPEAGDAFGDIEGEGRVHDTGRLRERTCSKLPGPEDYRGLPGISEASAEQQCA